MYLEAGACGKPTVATDAGGVRDAVLHEKTGLVANDGDIKQISDFISNLLGDDKLRQTYGDAAKAYAHEHKWANIVWRYESMYAEVLDKKPKKKI